MCVSTDCSPKIKKLFQAKRFQNRLAADLSSSSGSLITHSTVLATWVNPPLPAIVCTAERKIFAANSYSLISTFMQSWFRQRAGSSCTHLSTLRNRLKRVRKRGHPRFQNPKRIPDGTPSECRRCVSYLFFSGQLQPRQTVGAT